MPLPLKSAVNCHDESAGVLVPEGAAPPQIQNELVELSVHRAWLLNKGANLAMLLIDTVELAHDSFRLIDNVEITDLGAVSILKLRLRG